MDGSAWPLGSDPLRHPAMSRFWREAARVGIISLAGAALISVAAWAAQMSGLDTPGSTPSLDWPLVP